MNWIAIDDPRVLALDPRLNLAALATDGKISGARFSALQDPRCAELIVRRQRDRGRQPELTRVALAGLNRTNARTPKPSPAPPVPKPRRVHKTPAPLQPGRPPQPYRPSVRECKPAPKPKTTVHSFAPLVEGKPVPRCPVCKGRLNTFNGRCARRCDVPG